MDENKDLGIPASAEESGAAAAEENNTVAASAVAVEQDAAPSGAADGNAAAHASTSVLLQPYSQLQPWHRQMRDWLGQKEVHGKQHNPLIIAMHALTSLRATTDEIPWCSAAMCKAMHDAGYAHTHSAAAKSWLHYGNTTTMQVGAIAVLTRRGGHHVGIVEGWDDTHVWLLGGNQGDAVSVARFQRDRILSIRWPASEVNIKQRNQQIA